MTCCTSMTIFSVLVDKQSQFLYLKSSINCYLPVELEHFCSTMIMIMLKEVDTFTSITHHYSNAITQFITQFITQMPLLKLLLIITQFPFSLLTITPPLLKGHFADDRDLPDASATAGQGACGPQAVGLGGSHAMTILCSNSD